MGESCTDVFVYGNVTRLAPEGPVPVLNPETECRFPGMAANVRKNVIALLNENYLSDNVTLISNNPESLVTKTRFVEKISNHLLLRVDANDKSYGRIDYSNINFDDYDAVIISDYNKGLISENEILEISMNHPVTILDTKKILGDWALKCAFIKINENEFEKTKSVMPDGIENKLIVTMGALGARWRNKEFPVENVERKDTSGAGDTFVAAFTVKYVKCRNIEDSIRFANRCATDVIQQRGTATPRFRC